MKTKNIKIKSLIFCLLVSMNVWGVNKTIENISYSLNTSDRTATVIGSSLVDVVVPETIVYDGVTYRVEAVESEAFYKNSIIKSFKSSSIRYLYSSTETRGCFRGASNLKEVYFENLSIIGNYAFKEASSLRKIQVGDKLVSIGEDAFKGCSMLKYIVIPQTISSIEYGAFYGCTNLFIICLRQGKATGYSSQTIYPSSFFSFDKNTFTYNGKAPEVNYTFNGIGQGFQPTAVNMESLPTTVGWHTANLLCSFANDDMSFDVEIPFTYTINPVTLTAKVNDAQRVYGDADPKFETEYSGFVNGEDASVISSHGTYTTTATAKSDVGTYVVKQAGAMAENYVFEYEDGTLTVNKAPLTMMANDKTMTYGGSVPTLDAHYEGLKNNETAPAWNVAPTFATTASPTCKVGTYPITISGGEAKNYDVTTSNGTLTVGKAELTVRVENKSRLYGDSNPDFTLAYTGLKNNETIPEWEKSPAVETTANVQSAVGNYPISIKDAVAVNYNITPVEGTLTVNKAALKVTPKNVTRKYGEDNPLFALQYEGLKNNESEPEWTTTPTITTTASRKSSVGDYSIQLTSGVARNYTLEKNSGTLTIIKAPLTVGIKNCSRKYGEANPKFELSYDGLVNGETLPAWTVLPEITTEATAASAVGEYAITATGGVMKNYETSAIAPGVLTIAQAALLIRAKNASRLYYEENPELTYSCTGFVGNDNESALTVKPRMQTTAVLSSGVGIYPINISGAESNNYALSYENATLTVNKRELTVSTKNYTRAYGEENPEFELKYKGFVNNEDESVLLVKPQATTEADEESEAGEYDINIANGVAENYAFKYVGGKLTVEKAYQTLTWKQELGKVEQYEQIELLATASSGLDVTYTIEGAPVCSIVKIGKKQYLDCFGEGKAVVVAIQEGNQNYWQTPKIYKTIEIGNTTGIDRLIADGGDDEEIYDLNGNRVKGLRRGVNIVKTGDGKTRKVVVK